MCGLLAMHTVEKSGFTAWDRDEFKQMLLLTSIRGAHSTGIAGIDQRKDNSEISVVKSVGSPYNLYSYEATNQFFTRMLNNFTTVLGHGRFATKGAINAINAHPFEEGHITLAHNGVISNFWGLKDFTKHKNIEVDSHLIAKLIEEEGAINVLPKVEGAYVFMWYDRNDSTFNIARNKERPLFVVEQEDKETLTFASEAQTLLWNGSRNNTKYTDPIGIEEMQIFTFNKDSLEPIITPYKQEPKKIISYSRGYPDYDAYARPVYKEQSKNKFSDSYSSGSGNVAIKVDQKIVFSIEDIMQKGKTYIMVSGTNSLYPNVLFHSTFSNGETEEDIYKADFVEGTVSSIYPNRKTPDEYPWQCFIRNCTLKTFVPDDADDDEARVQIMNVLGHTESVTRYRLKEMAKQNCAWCLGKIQDKELFEPDKLLIYDVTSSAQEIVCPSCAESTIKTLIRH